MIPRHQKILFAVLLIATIGLGFLVWRLRRNDHDRLLRGEDSAPTKAPAVAPAETATLFVANDQDGSLSPEQFSLPLPADNSARAHALLNKLLEIYSAADSTHPVPASVPAVLNVFLMPQPGAPQDKNKSADSGPLLAVINLTAAFANNHPSGIEPEMLTLNSIGATLHANIPRIAEIRYLVDGEARPTLAGHADLTQTYLTAQFDEPGESSKSSPKSPSKNTHKPANPSTKSKTATRTRRKTRR